MEILVNAILDITLMNINWSVYHVQINVKNVLINQIHPVYLVIQINIEFWMDFNANVKMVIMILTKIFVFNVHL